MQVAPFEVAASAPRNEQGDTAISEKVAAQPSSVGEIVPPAVGPRASAVEPSAAQGDSRNRVTSDRRPTAPDGAAPTEAEAQFGAAPTTPSAQSKGNAVRDPSASSPPARSDVAPDPAVAPAQPRPELSASSTQLRPDAAPEPSAPAAQPSTGGVAAPVEDLLGVVEAAWPEIKGKVREFGATLQALLSGAAVSRVDGGVVVFAHQSPPLAQRLSDPRNIDAVRSAVRAVLGRELDVRWETGMPAPRPAPVVKGSGAPARGPGEDKPAARPRFSRPSQAKGNQGRPAGQRGPGEDDIPPPDFPDLPDDPGPEESYGPDSGRSGGESGRASKPGGGVPAPPTPEEEQEMLAAAAEPVAPGDRQDPDEVALALLRDELGAKSLDG